MVTAERAMIDWMRLIQAEYREMPGLHLTKPQVKRLWGLDQRTCDVLLDALERERVLRRLEPDVYVLAEETAETF